MPPLADALARLGDALAAAVDATGDDGGLRAMGDHEVLAALAAAGRIPRLAEAVVDGVTQ